MSLAKLFNFKYFWQNVKKSKMAIILFLSIVPIFTALTIIMTASNEEVLESYELGLANIIFMYITPFVLSFSLFGYVYKKKSIDFIGSMPISRKTIFITNTIGGIIMLILSQLVTLIVSLILSLFVDVVIFPGMLLDIFIYQSIAYIFVFMVSNLAMSVSGNVVTQIVVTLLILFVIPVTALYSDAWSGASYKLMDGDYNITRGHSIIGARNYTAPSFVFDIIVTGETPIYNSVSMAKMVLLSIAYGIIGYYMFKKKKMEYAGESFENMYVHLTVKGLTTIPLVMLLVVGVDNASIETNLFLIAVIAVYYLIYDLITNRKNKIRVNLIAMIVSTLVLFGAYTVIGNISEDMEGEIQLKDVKAIAIQDIGYRMTNLNCEINDKELIKEVVYNTMADRNKNDRQRIRVELKMFNGSKKRYNAYIDVELLEKVLDTVTSGDYLDVEFGANNINLSKEERKNLKIALNNAIRENGLFKLYSSIKDNPIYRIRGYQYKNHNISQIDLDIDISDDVFNIITIAENRNIAEYIRRRDYDYMYLNVSPSKYFEYYGECPDEIKSYIVENKEKICKKNEPYLILSIDGHKFYTNDVENVKNIIKNSKEFIDESRNDYNEYYDKNYVDTEVIYDENSVNTEPIYNVY